MKLDQSGMDFRFFMIILQINYAQLIKNVILELYFQQRSSIQIPLLMCKKSIINISDTNRFKDILFFPKLRLVKKRQCQCEILNIDLDIHVKFFFKFIF